jgi:hypothetical protein
LTFIALEAFEETVENTTTDWFEEKTYDQMIDFASVKA